MNRFIEKLYSKLEERGLKGRVVSIQRLQDLQDEIEGRHTQGLFDEDFYQEGLSFFSFRPPDDLPMAAVAIVYDGILGRMVWKRTCEVAATFIEGGLKKPSWRPGQYVSPLVGGIVEHLPR